MAVSPTDEFPHGDAAVDEWIFVTWSPDATIGFVSGHRLVGRTAWYWSAMVELGQPLLHLAVWDAIVRADPFIVKAPEMWAEHHCDAPLEQWSIGNEAHFTALDDPDEALGRCYGTPTPMAADVEWYASAGPSSTPNGFEQPGVAHGVIELLDRPNVEFDEWPAHRWRRWGTEFGPLPVATLVAHTGLRAPFAFPDGTVSDWVLGRDGWYSRPNTQTGVDGPQSSAPTEALASAASLGSGSMRS